MPRFKEPSKRRRDRAGTGGQAALLGGLAALIGGGAFALPIYPTAQTSNATTPTYVGDPTIGVSQVNLTAPRTIIDWLGFGIAPGETLTFNANARSDIVLNRLADPSQIRINGTMNSLVGGQTGGNVWLAAPAGVIFGPNAVVNVGGLLATSGALTDVSDFLDPTKSSFNFRFSGRFAPDPNGTNLEVPYYGGVVVQTGAKLATSKGLLALVAPFVTVRTGSTVGDVNTGDVLLGGAVGYTISLSQETTGDLDLLEFQIPPISVGNTLRGETPVAPAIAMAGAVTGKNVFLTALSLQGLTNAIVTDSGQITATGALQQGDGTVILTADTVDLVPASYPNGAVFDPTLGLLPTSGSNLFMPQYATPLSFGAITAPQTYIHTGGIAQQAASTTLAGGGALVSAGDISLTGVNLAGSFKAVAEPLAAAQYAGVGATAPGGTLAGGPVTANDIAIHAAANISAGALNATGGPLSVLSDNGTVQTGALTATGAVTVNSPNGGIETSAVTAGGALSLTGAGVQGLSFSGFVFTGALTSGGALTVSAPYGGMSLGAVNAGGPLTLTSGGAPSLSLSGYVEATSLASTGAVMVNGYTISTGAVTGQSVTMAAASGGNGVTAGDVSATGGPLTLTAASGAVSPTSATATGAITLTSTSGAVAVGIRPSSDILNGHFTPGPVTGQSIAMSAATNVTAGVVQATGGPLTASAATGSVALSSASATGALSLTAPSGALSIGTNVYAADGVTLIGFTPGAVSGQSVSMSDNGALLAGGVTATGGPLTVSAANGAVTLSSATATGALSLTSPNSTVSVGGAVSGQGVTVSAINGITLGAVAATGGALSLAATNGAVGAGSLQATGDIGVSGTSIVASTVNAGGAATLSAAHGSGGPTATGSASVQLGSLSATQASVLANDGPTVITSANIGSGGLLVHANGPLGDVWLGYASAGTGGGTGSLTGSASLYAVHDVNVDTSGSANLAVVNAADRANLRSETGNLTAGSVTTLNGLTAAAPQGSIILGPLQPTVLTGSAQAGLDLTITDAGNLNLAAFSMTAGRSATLSTPGQLTVSALSAGQDMSLTGAAIQAGPNLSAGGNAAFSASGLVTLAGLTAGGSASITAGDLSLTGALTAPTVTIASLSGPLTLGGSGAGAGLVLDGTEFGRITASTALNLYAGAPAGTARGGLTVQNLTIDPAKVPNLNLYAASGQTVSIAGALAPIASGGAVSVGGPAGWTPTTILVTGGLGAATRLSDTQFTGVRAFNQVSLNALGDVLMGSTRFIGLVQAARPDQIDLALNLPAGVQPQGAEIGRVYLASGRLAVVAGGKVLGQNTSGGQGGYSGVYLANRVGAPGAVLTLDPPSVVDLFGSYVNRSGALSSGPAAAVGPDLSVLTTGNRQNYRFNGCVIGVGCSSAIPGPAQGLQPLNGLQTVFVSDATDASEAASEGAAAADSAEAASAPGSRLQAPAFTVLPSAGTDAQADPVVTGTGNEEIWRKRGGNSQ